MNDCIQEQQLFMSVLFIGQPTPYSPQLHPQHIITPHLRKARQEKYRHELLQQIQEKRNLKERQRQQEKRQEMRYDAYLKQDLPQNIFSTPTHTNNHSYLHFASKIPRSTTEPQQDRQHTPSGHKQRKSIFTPSAFDLPTISVHPPRLHSPLGTNSDYVHRPFQEFIDSYERREQQLREYQNKRFEEVYEKMYNSVDSLTNSEEECQVIRSRMKPVDLRPSRSNTHPNPNPEEIQQPHFKLPPIVKISQSRKHPQEEDSNWREWYAKEKLRELDEYYRKALIDDQTRERQQNDYVRAGTPVFAHRRS